MWLYTAALLRLFLLTQPVTRQAWGRRAQPAWGGGQHGELQQHAHAHPLNSKAVRLNVLCACAVGGGSACQAAALQPQRAAPAAAQQ